MRLGPPSQVAAANGNRRNTLGLKPRILPWIHREMAPNPVFRDDLFWSFRTSSFLLRVKYCGSSLLTNLPAHQPRIESNNTGYGGRSTRHDIRTIRRLSGTLR